MRVTFEVQQRVARSVFGAKISNYSNVLLLRVARGFELVRSSVLITSVRNVRF